MWSLTFDLSMAPPGKGDRELENLRNMDSEEIEKIVQEKRIAKQGQTVPLNDRRALVKCDAEPKWSYPKGRPEGNEHTEQVWPQLDG